MYLCTSEVSAVAPTGQSTVHWNLFICCIIIQFKMLVRSAPKSQLIWLLRILCVVWSYLVDSSLKMITQLLLDFNSNVSKLKKNGAQTFVSPSSYFNQWEKLKEKYRNISCEWTQTVLNFTLRVRSGFKCVYLVPAALTGLQACQDLALYSRHPRVPVLQALSLKVPRLPGKWHNDKVCVLFVCK